MTCAVVMLWGGAGVGAGGKGLQALTALSRETASIDMHSTFCLTLEPLFTDYCASSFGQLLDCALYGEHKSCGA